MRRNDVSPATVASVATTTTLLLGLVSSSATPTRGVWLPSVNRSQSPSVLKLAPMEARGSALTPIPIDLPSWLTQARARLAELSRLPDDWGGSEKPSELAIGVAWSLVQSMERQGHRVLRIAPIADGGLSVRFAEGARSARFDVYNEGGIVIATRVNRTVPAQHAELPEADAVAELSRFLEHDDDATAAG